jgi:hypothetical protein
MSPGRQPPMSRRHHGNRPHRSGGPQRPTDPVRSGLEAPTSAADIDGQTRPAPGGEPPVTFAHGVESSHLPLGRAAGHAREVAEAHEPDHDPVSADGSDHPSAPPHVERTNDSGGAAAAGPGRFARAVDADLAPAPGHADGRPRPDDPAPQAHDERGTRPDGPVMNAIASCTAPQLRRFIKSRPYVPMHELRRRFGINGSEDDVSSIDLGDHRVYVGLPAREGSLLGELLRGGDIGFELSLDPRTPIVIGLYPMRPVAR